uniref:Uncharacterized protein n=1 Tax=Arundo donax TaxID=35708 RepID=A0A0A9CSD5_ARUDO
MTLKPQQKVDQLNQHQHNPSSDMFLRDHHSQHEPLKDHKRIHVSSAHPRKARKKNHPHHPYQVKYQHMK